MTERAIGNAGHRCNDEFVFELIRTDVHPAPLVGEVKGVIVMGALRQEKENRCFFDQLQTVCHSVQSTIPPHAAALKKTAA
ncbi:MAG TPA: hypothetical protein VNT02_14040 [Burkholderiales bacterium]|nr:hypothetical protein [Burkholderiales bacterium]